MKDTIYKQLQILIERVEELTKRVETLATTQVDTTNRIHGLETLLINYMAQVSPQTPPYGELNDFEKGIALQGPGSTGKIEAIKSYRKRTHCGLKAAKEAVEAWMAMAVQEAKEALAKATAPEPFSMSMELNDHEKSLVYGPCGKIEAIVAFRARTHRGLKEAKEAVESWMQANPPLPPLTTAS
jgi:ribosomal protein L7/L12